MSQKPQAERAEKVAEKLRELPPEKIAEVEDFVDFLRERDGDRRLVRGAGRLAEDTFRKIWENDDDAVYDDL